MNAISAVLPMPDAKVFKRHLPREIEQSSLGARVEIRRNRIADDDSVRSTVVRTGIRYQGHGEQSFK